MFEFKRLIKLAAYAGEGGKLLDPAAQRFVGGGGQPGAFDRRGDLSGDRGDELNVGACESPFAMGAQPYFADAAILHHERRGDDAFDIVMFDDAAILRRDAPVAAGSPGVKRAAGEGGAQSEIRIIAPQVGELGGPFAAAELGTRLGPEFTFGLVEQQHNAEVCREQIGREAHDLAANVFDAARRAGDF